MSAQQQLGLNVEQVDLNRLVKFTPDPFGSRWVCFEGNKRRGSRGKSLGVLEIQNARSFAVVLLLDDGRIESFHPQSLHPDIAANAGMQPMTPNAGIKPTRNMRTGSRCNNANDTLERGAEAGSA